MKTEGSWAPRSQQLGRRPQIRHESYPAAGSFLRPTGSAAPWNPKPSCRETADFLPTQACMAWPRLRPAPRSGPGLSTTLVQAQSQANGAVGHGTPALLGWYFLFTVWLFYAPGGRGRLNVTSERPPSLECGDKAAFPWPVCPHPALASNCPVPCPRHRGAHRQVWGWPFLGRTCVQLRPAQSRPHSREFFQQYHSPDLTPKLNQNPWAGAWSACL